MELALQIIYVIICVILVAVVLMQSSKQQGITGVVQGASETFFGKNKGRTVDAILDKWTSFLAVAFIVISLILTLMSK